MGALFLDLDGTLLDSRKEVRPEDRQALRDASARGHAVAIVSGRPLESVLAQARALDLDGPGSYLAAYNGGVVWDCARRTALIRRTLPPSVLYGAFDEARRRGIHIQTYDRGEVVIERWADPAVVQRYCDMVGMRWHAVDDIRRDLSERPCKALLIDYQGRGATAPMRDWLRGQFQGEAESFFSGPHYLELVPAGTDKGTAVRELCRLLGIPAEDAVAVGDEANDIPMLRAAGTGIAMANATDEVKAEADAVTERDNDHGGVAEAVRRYLPGPACEDV